jgi:CheY-like chemotaxis protein
VVIDDDQSARDLLQRQLGKEGFRVLAASDGEQGLRLIREFRPSFITLDVMMPVMDGWDVLAVLKADPDLCEIPVIILTMIDDGQMGLALGATDYVTKPVDKQRLLALSQKYRNAMETGQSLLVIEDDKSSRELIGRLLAGEGWSVTEAENGRVALEKIDQCRPALIVLDLLMPEMDGFTFLRELRKKPKWQTTPVVIVTAKDLTPQERSLLNGGVQMILQKGDAGREQLLEQVRALFRLRQESPVSALDATRCATPVHS